MFHLKLEEKNNIYLYELRENSEKTYTSTEMNRSRSQPMSSLRFRSGEKGTEGERVWGWKEATTSLHLKQLTSLSVWKHLSSDINNIYCVLGGLSCIRRKFVLSCLKSTFSLRLILLDFSSAAHRYTAELFVSSAIMSFHLRGTICISRLSADLCLQTMPRCLRDRSLNMFCSATTPAPWKDNGTQFCSS